MNLLKIHGCIHQKWQMAKFELKFNLQMRRPQNDFRVWNDFIAQFTLIQYSIHLFVN